MKAFAVLIVAAGLGAISATPQPQQPTDTRQWHSTSQPSAPTHLMGSRGESGTGQPADAQHVKRHCWYVPGPDAATMLVRQQQVRAYYTHTVTNGNWNAHIKLFADKIGKKGRWWTPDYDASDHLGPSCASTLTGALWVPAGATPPRHR
jgi:hypothetical protein